MRISQALALSRQQIIRIAAVVVCASAGACCVQVAPGGDDPARHTAPAPGVVQSITADSPQAGVSLGKRRVVSVR